MFENDPCVAAHNASPANTLDGNDQEAPHCVLCTSPLTEAPCCTGTSKSDTSEPPRNWKKVTERQMLHSDKTAKP